MSPINRLITQIRRRQFLARLIGLSGRWVFGSACAAIAILVADRVLGLEWPNWSFAAIACSGLVPGLLMAASKRENRAAAASVLDDHFNLRDRLRSAYDQESDPALRDPRWRTDDTSNAFAHWLQRDAESFASKIDARNAVPLRWPESATWALVCFVALVAGSLFLPSLGARASNELAQLDARMEREAARQRARESLQSVAREVSIQSSASDALEDGDSEENENADDPLQDVARDLERLNEQLTMPENASDTDARSVDPEGDTASELMRMADNLDDAAAQRDSTMNELAQRFSGLEPNQREGEETERDRLLRESIEALRRGEMGEALRQLDALEENRDTLSPTEREQLAQRLRDLAERMEQIQQESSAERERNLEERMRELEDFGFTPEEAREIAEGEVNPEDIPEDRLPEALDDIERERLREELERTQQEQESSRAADEQFNEMSEGLREWADSMERQPQAPEPPQPQQQQQPPADTETESRPPGESPSEQPSPTDEQTPEQGRDPNQEQTGDTEEQGTPQSREETTPANDSPTPEATEQAPETSPQPGQPQPGEQTGEQTDAPQPSQRREPGSQPQPGVTPGSQPDTSDPSSPDSMTPDSTPPGTVPPSPTGRERIQEAIRRMEEQRNRAEREREVGERLRDEARRLMREDDRSPPQPPDQMPSDGTMPPTPQSGNESEPGNSSTRPDDQRPSSPSGGPGGNADDAATSEAVDDELLYDVEDVDARRTNERDTSTTDEPSPDNLVIEEWLQQSNDGAGDGERGTSAPVDQSRLRRIRETSRSIERALNEQAIPSRYAELLRRWAGRIEKVAEKKLEESGSNVIESTPDDGEE